MSVSAEAIKQTIISGAITAYQITEKAVIWCGHKIQVGFSSYLLPTLKSLWAMAVVGLTRILAFVKTGPGMAFSASAFLFITGGALIRSTQSGNYADREATRVFITSLGIAAIVAGTLAAGVGVSFLPLL